MTKFQKSLVFTALLALPFTATQARDEAWIKAQKIDIQPTLRVTETEIPAGSTATTPGYPSTSGQTVPGSNMPSTGTPSTNMPYSNTPSTNTPSTNMPSTNMPSTNMPSTGMPSHDMPSGHMPSHDMPSGHMPSGGPAGTYPGGQPMPR